MALSRSKYKRVPDLYTTGTEYTLKDDTVLWLQVLNPFEQDEAKMDAQAARARLVLALKSPHGSKERDIVRSWFLDDGMAAAVDRLVDAKLGPKIIDIVNDIRSDPDWKERLLITERQDELLARPLEDAERQILNDVNNDFVKEVTDRSNSERDYLRHVYEELDEDGLFDEYIEAYIERRGMDLSLAEYALTELWYAARVCDAGQIEDGSWDHSKCENHGTQVWENKVEVRALPEDLQSDLTVAMQRLNMTAREAKNSARQGNSSESFPLPSAAVESTPSTPVVTSAGVPGS